MEIQHGDQLLVEISGSSADWVDEIKELVSDALEPDIIPLASGDASESGEFSATAIAIGFLVATASGLTVEGLRALIAGRIARRTRQGARSTRNIPPAEVALLPNDIEVSVSIDSAGLVKATIRQLRTDDNHVTN